MGGALLLAQPCSGIFRCQPSQVHSGARGRCRTLCRRFHRPSAERLGLVAFGRIPQLVDAESTGIRSGASCLRPFVPKERLAKGGVEPVDFRSLLKKSPTTSPSHSPSVPGRRRGLFQPADAIQADEMTAVRGQHGARPPDHDEAGAWRRAPLPEKCRPPALDNVMTQSRRFNSPAHRQQKSDPHASTPALLGESLVDLHTKASQELGVGASPGNRPLNPVDPDVLHEP